MISIAAQLIGHELSVYSSSTLTSDSVGSDMVNFIFDENWDGYNKTVLFWGADSDVPYGAALDSDNNAIIPHEVMTEKGTFRFGIFGEDSQNIRPRITSTIVKIKVVEGAWGSYIEGDDEATPTLVEQLRQIVYNVSGDITQLQEDVAGIENDISNIDGAISDIQADVVDVKTILPDIIKIVPKTGTIPANVQYVTLQADIVEDYQFVCWVAAYSLSGAVSLTVTRPLDDGRGTNEVGLYRTAASITNAIDYVVLQLYIYKQEQQEQEE